MSNENQYAELLAKNEGFNQGFSEAIKLTSEKLRGVVIGVANAFLMTEDYCILNQGAQLDRISNKAYSILSDAGFDIAFGITPERVKGIVLGVVYDEEWQ